MASIILNSALVALGLCGLYKCNGLKLIAPKNLVNLIAEAFLIMLLVIGFLELMSFSNNSAIQQLVAKYTSTLNNQVQVSYYPLKATLGAVLEELIFRGPYLVLAFILSWLINKKSLKIKRIYKKLLNAAFIFGSAYLFARAHSLALQQMYAFFVGLILGHKTIKRRNILEPMVIHAAFNLMNLSALAKYVSFAWLKLFVILHI